MVDILWQNDNEHKKECKIFFPFSRSASDVVAHSNARRKIYFTLADLETILKV